MGPTWPGYGRQCRGQLGNVGRYIRRREDGGGRCPQQCDARYGYRHGPNLPPGQQFIIVHVYAPSVHTWNPAARLLLLLGFVFNGVDCYSESSAVVP
jgi:hypothetical protein